MRNKSYFIFLIFTIQLVFAGATRPCGDSLPIIYSPNYNISILGVENFHPFDSKKYGKVYDALISDGLLCPKQFYQPVKVSDDQLLLIHDAQYLKSLSRSDVIAQIVEISPIQYLPYFIIESGVLNPMRFATGGTILGVQLALRYGWAINLSGGYHHAKSDRGEGFSVYADVPIALKSIWKEKPSLKVLIVDLDAHQGNGNSTILMDEPRVAILDMFNSSIYPYDPYAKKGVKYLIPLQMRTNTYDYLDSLKKWLPIAIENEKPELLVYNAGTDVYMNDPLGRLSITADGIIERDGFVFDKAIENKIPILMVLSGGYHRKSGAIIAKSILAILEKHNELKRKTAPEN